MQDPANPSAEVVIRRFDEQHNKYKFMEANLAQKKKRQVLTLPPPPPPCSHLCRNYCSCDVEAQNAIFLQITEANSRHSKFAGHGKFSEVKAGM